MRNKIIAVWICALLTAGLFIGLIPTTGEGAPPGQGFNLEFDYTDGTSSDSGFIWDFEEYPYAHNQQGIYTKYEVTPSNYLRVENTGAYSFDFFYFDLLSFGNGEESIDLSAPGTWALDYGTLSDFTSTTTTTENYSYGDPSTPYGNEIINNPYPGGLRVKRCIHRTVTHFKGNGVNNKDFVKYVAPHLKNCAHSPLTFNYTLGAGESLYIKPVLLLDSMPSPGAWTLTHTIQGYDNWQSYGELTRAVASDTDTGSSTMQISSTTDFTISYTGTHPDEVYFSKLYGSPTSSTTSINNMRVTNTGNTIINSVSCDVGAINEWVIVGTTNPAGYDLSSNVRFQRIGGALQTCSPVGTVSSIAIAPGGTMDFAFVLTSIPSLAVNSYEPADNPIITAYSTTGSQTGALDMLLAIAGGTLDTTSQYTSGSSFSFPNANPGDTSVQSFNAIRIICVADSDYPITSAEILLSPLTYAGNVINFGDNADLIIEDEEGSQFTYPLATYSSGGINYGRALITFDDTDTGKPNIPTQDESFYIMAVLYTIPAVVPGTYSGNWIVTSSYNPVSILTGSMGFGVDLSGDINRFNVIYDPDAPRVGDVVKITFQVFTITNTTLYGDYHLIIKDKSSNYSVIVDTVVNNITYSELVNTSDGYRRTCLKPYNFTANKTGDYEVSINYTVKDPVNLTWEDLSIGNRTNFTVKSASVWSNWWDNIVSWFTAYFWYIMILTGATALIVYVLVAPSGKKMFGLAFIPAGAPTTLNAQAGLFSGFTLSSGVCCLMLFLLLIISFVFLYYLVKVLRGNGSK